MTHNLPGTDLREVCRIATTMGVTSVEVTAIKSHGHRPNSIRWVDIYDDPGKQVEVANDHGVSLNSLGLHCDLITDDEALHYLKTGIDFAVEAGIPTIVNGEGPKADDMDDETAFSIARERTIEVVEYCERRGVRYALEPHGLFSRQLDGLERLIGVHDSPSYVVNYEIGNLMTAPDIDTAEHIPRFLDRIGHVHIKDKVFQPEGPPRTAVIGTGDVNVSGCIETLWESGYRGIVSIEVYPTATDDPIAETRTGVEYVRAQIARLSANGS